MSDKPMIPPPEIKDIIDQIAEFVSGKGRSIEEKIIEREADNPEFDFLKDKSHEFHPYYEAKLEEFAKSKGLHVQKRLKQREDPYENIEKEKKPEPKPSKTQEDLRREINRRKNAKPPPPDQFQIHHPELHIIDSEIIKLTAQFVTRNGQKFLAALSDKQANNPQFDFLKPTHKLFSYFTSLVDSYSKTFAPKTEYINKLKKYVYNKSDIWEQKIEERPLREKELKLLQEEEEEPHKEEEFEIDWDDFVVVQTIDFDDDDDRYIRPDLQQLGVEDVSTKIDKIDQDIKKELFKMEGIKNQIEIEPGMKIVENYDKKRRDEKREQFQTCPKCNKSIPMSEWSEHLRLELLDPKWREEKLDYINRQKNPTTAEGLDVTRELKKMVSNRPDIARTDTASHLSQISRIDEPSQTNKVIWDGHSSSITRTTANSAMLAQQQRRNLEEAIHTRGGNVGPGGQNMPPRPPSQAQLLGYPAPPGNQNNQGNTQNLVPPRKANPNNNNQQKK